ncbi:MAG: hypothetical protein R6U84_02390 [Candidatus Cloacimonadales bacterium]
MKKMINYASAGLLILLTACTQNVTIDRTPLDAVSKPFTSTGGKQIEQLSSYKYQVKSSIVSGNLSQEEMDELSRLKAAKTALEYFRQTSVDSAFMSIYSELYDRIQPQHLLDLQAEVAAGLIQSIEEKEVTLTKLPQQTIQLSSYDITIRPPKSFTPQVELFIDLNQTKYAAGDTLKIFLQSNLPTYLTVLHIRPDGWVETIESNPKNEIYQTKEIHIFSQVLDWQAENLAESQGGIIKIFASTQKIDFALWGNLKVALQALIKEMQALETSELSEIGLEYQLEAK